MPDDAAEPGNHRLLVTSEARAAVTLAREEASAMGAPAVGSEHLLLGIIRCRAPSTAAGPRVGGHHARRRAPLRAPDARGGRADRRARPRAGPQPGPRGISAYARAVFELALREATKRGDGYVGVDHLLLASLEDPNGGACRTLCELGLDPEQVRSGLAA